VLAQYFTDRSKALRAGKNVEPVLAGQWTLDPTTMREASKARLELTSRLNNGAQLTAPRPAAIAQVNFDCWMAQFPAVGGPPSSADCGRKFYSALAELPANPGPAAAAPASPPSTLAATKPQCITQNQALDCRRDDPLASQVGALPTTPTVPGDPGAA